MRSRRPRCCSWCCCRRRWSPASSDGVAGRDSTSPTKPRSTDDGDDAAPSSRPASCDRRRSRRCAGSRSRSPAPVRAACLGSPTATRTDLRRHQWRSRPTRGAGSCCRRSLGSVTPAPLSLFVLWLSPLFKETLAASFSHRRLVYYKCVVLPTELALCQPILDPPPLLWLCNVRPVVRQVF